MKTYFNVSMLYEDADKTITVSEVVQIEHVDNEDGLQVIFWKNDGTGERYPLYDLTGFLVVPIVREEYVEQLY